MRGRLAVQYARTLAFSALAEQQGFDKSPVLAKELDDQLKLVRTRILASAFLQTLQEQTNKILEPEVQRYYAKHQEEFEQAQVRRLSVPFAVPTEDGQPLDHTAVKSEMELLRSQAVAGDDFDQLQRDAYKHLHIRASPPANALLVRRSDLQGEEAKTFDLSPGEVSNVLDLPGAYALVKLESKQIMPIESVRQEIETALRRERMQDAITKLGKRVTAQFNLQYLEMSSQPDIFGVTGTNSAASGGGPKQASAAAR